jgi:hypothetical protein
MATPRYDHTATRLSDGRVLVAGGVASEDGHTLASAELYDPTTGKFTATGSMLFPRQMHTATLLPDGRVLIAGGTNDTEETAKGELYDPATGKFSFTGWTNTFRARHTATLLLDGRVLIVGGVGPDTAPAELYDPETGHFSLKGSMSTVRYGHTATLLADGRVLIAGGRPQQSLSYGLASAEIYDPATGKISPTGSMSGNRMWHAAARLSDGRVLVVGGQGDLINLTVAELFDPATGTFGKVAMPTAFSGGTATLLPDGRVLIAGGLDAAGTGDASAAAELFDPKTQTFTATGSVVVPRCANTATLLNDGRVLIVGGKSSNGASTGLASAELFQP